MTTSFISDQDFTTPAHVRAAPPEERRVRETKSASRALLSVTFLAAVWLVVSSVPFGYIGAGRYDIFWSDAVTGITIAIVTTLRLLHPRTVAFAWVSGGLAGWVLMAPLVLQYGWSTSTANDIVVGLLMLVCAALGPADEPE
ncbi:SPW repeat domain-containing protein [Dactylosporangium sp. CA-139066]|uniref:SPW repeat domain-containing protein n=1 Tax=Dactylosporangium sp. CA-139066 TaxID=3239930 RepID=UPI003D9314E8